MLNHGIQALDPVWLITATEDLNRTKIGLENGKISKQVKNSVPSRNKFLKIIF